MDTVIFVPELIEYAFLGVSLSEAKFMLESIQMNHATLFTNVCALQSTGWYMRHYLIYLTNVFIWNARKT